jgi:hypothetical protein
MQPVNGIALLAKTQWAYAPALLSKYKGQPNAQWCLLLPRDTLPHENGASSRYVCAKRNIRVDTAFAKETYLLALYIVHSPLGISQPKRQDLFECHLCVKCSREIFVTTTTTTTYTTSFLTEYFHKK